MTYDQIGIYPLIVGASVMICAIVCLIISLYWFFKPTVGYSFSKAHEHLWFLIHLGAGLPCYIIILFGTKDVLWFISGENKDSYFGIASGIATVMTGFLFYGFYAFGKMRRECQCMKAICEMEEAKKEFEYLSETALKQKAIKYRQRLHELCMVTLSPELEVESCYLHDIVDELEKRIEELQRKDEE